MVRVSATMVGAAVAGVLALSACGAKSEAGQPVAEQGQGQVQEASGDSQSVRLAVAQVGNLGSVVTDQNGLTLYRFDKDKAKPPVSNCKEDCAVAWPPVTVGDLSELKLANVDKGLVGVLEREDGTKQVTLAGWALYRYKDDKKAGDAKGQGINGTWFAATPEGKKAQAKAKVNNPAPAPPPEQSSGGGGGSGGYGY
jgi:predicted lipoprotein with Yx(FWY)xxD motif